MGTTMQQKWVSWLLGYDFVVEYRKGSDNRVANALCSREEEEEIPITLTMIFVPTLELLKKIKGYYKEDAVAQ